MPNLIFPHAFGLNAPRLPFTLNKASPLARRLVGWWPFREGAGSSAIDYARGNTAKFINSPKRTVKETLGQCINFVEGDDDYLETGSTPVTAAPLTIGGWCIFRTSTIGDRHTTMSVTSAGPDSSDQDFFRILHRNTGIRVQAGADGSFDEVNGATTIIALRPYFISASFSSSDGIELYVNGLLDGSGALSVTPDAAKIDRIHFGHEESAGIGNQAMDGQLGDHGLWNRRLPPAEHFALYNPATRRDRYQEPLRKSYFFVSGAVAFTSTNLALHHSGASDIGGAIGAALTDDALNNIWDDVSSGDADAGDTEFRCTYVKNTHASLSVANVKVEIATDPTESNWEIALGAAGKNGTETAVADEDTAPATPTFDTTPLILGTLAAGDFFPIWIKRIVIAGAGAASPDSGVLRILGDDPN